MNTEMQTEPSLEHDRGGRRHGAGRDPSVDPDPRALERWENEGGHCACDALVARRA